MTNRRTALAVFAFLFFFSALTDAGFINTLPGTTNGNPTAVTSLAISGPLSLPGEQVPLVALSSIQHDYACGNTNNTCLGTTTVYLSCSSGPGLCGLTGLTGFVDGTNACLPDADGALVTLVNTEQTWDHDITLYGDDGTTAAAGRFRLPAPITGATTSATFLLQASASKTFRYSCRSKVLRPFDSPNGNVVASKLQFLVQHDTDTGTIDVVLDPNKSILSLEGASAPTVNSISPGYEGQQLSVECNVAGSSSCVLKNGASIAGTNGADIFLSANGGGGIPLEYVTVPASTGNCASGSPCGRWRVRGDSATHKSAQTFSGGFTSSGASTINNTLSMASHLINLVSDPVSAQDAATKNYVDGSHGYSRTGTSGPKWSSGTGVPAISCSIGDLFSRTDGSTSTTLYVCTATNTWTAK